MHSNVIFLMSACIFISGQYNISISYITWSFYAELKLAKDDLKLNKELNDALLEEVNNNEKAIEILKEKEKKHLEAIHTLELEVEKLREEKTSTSSECQTFFEEIRIPLQLLYG